MKKLLLFILLNCLATLHAQEPLKTDTIPTLAVKTNILYWASTTINLSAELRLDDRWTLDLAGSYNPFTFANDKKWKHWMIQPEARRWFNRSFDGHFLGVHLHGGQFNANRLNLPFGIGGDTFKNYRYEGVMYGAGIGYGYRWNWNRHWAMEAELGLGYFGFEYDKYDCETCGAKQGSGHEDFFGPTRIAVSLIYTIK